MNQLLSKQSILRQWEGPLTKELAQSSGQFGLGRIPERKAPDATTQIVCGYCSTGCGLKAHLKEGQAVNLSTSTEYPVNLGMACPKGWESLTPLAADDRATTPLMRDASGKLEPVNWDTAMKGFTDRFKKVQKDHGKESVAFISTGQIVMEEMAFLGAFAKFGMGAKHGDGNTRQCMATSVVAYKQSFGFDAPPYTYRDFEESDVLVFVGSNLCIAHPIMWQRVLKNPNDPEIIVIDPRRTETTVAGTEHYQIMPKSDLYLLYGVARELIKNDWIQQEYVEKHTEGFEEFVNHVERFTPEMVAKESGIPVERIKHLARLIHDGKRVSFWWTMGVNQGHEATRTAQAIINLALMTGNMGRPGTGANSITGQCNAMGSRLFSNTTNLLGGHDFTKPAHRRKIAKTLGMDDSCIPDGPSLAYDQIIDGIDNGTIKGLWIIATNTAHSWIHQKKVREVLGKLDFLVVQDMYHSTETAELADLILPAAGWGEKEGIFINSERRLGLVKKISKAPGQALSDFNIIKLAAHYWGFDEQFREWSSPEAVFQILKRCSKNQPCDITGIKDYRMLDECDGIQWPYPAAKSGRAEKDGSDLKECNERRLFERGRYYHSSGKAQFLYENPQPVLEPTDDDYPFVLLTGRGTSAQWHTQTRTGKSPVLRKLYPKNNYVEIHPEDASRLGIEEGGKVKVMSKRGDVIASAYITKVVRKGQVFMPMHYATTNHLTFPSFDPYSRQPSYKHAAVSIERA